VGSDGSISLALEVCSQGTCGTAGLHRAASPALQESATSGSKRLQSLVNRRDDSVSTISNPHGSPSLAFANRLFLGLLAVRVL
jgi:hypothetical protein